MPARSAHPSCARANDFGGLLGDHAAEAQSLVRYVARVVLEVVPDVPGEELRLGGLTHEGAVFHVRALGLQSLLVLDQRRDVVEVRVLPCKAQGTERLG